MAEFQQRIITLGGQPKGYNQESVIRALLEDWLGGKRTIEIVPQSASPKAIQDDMERLRSILETGSPSERDSVRGVIKAVSDAIQVRAAQNPSRPRSKPKPQKKAG